MATGRLIAVEGIDGAGKGTQVERLVAALCAAGRRVVATREPTDGPHGREIRALSIAGRAPSPAEQLALFMDDRAEHVARVIAPALERGDVVVTDRYFLSNAAYQGAAGLDAEAILVENESRFPVPDAAIVIRLDPDEALRRVAARGEARNRAFERADFLRRVATLYDGMTRPWIHRVDGDGDPDAVHARVRAALAGVVSFAPA